MNAAAEDFAQALVDLARDTLKDLQQRGVEDRRITLDSTLDHDLGLDSLARVELFTRIERRFGVRLPESLLGNAGTLRDIASALSGAPSAVQTAPRARPEAARVKGEAAAPPAHIATLDRLLAWRREQQPDFPQITIHGEGADEPITYEQLWREARRIAGGLQRRGVRLGDAVALMLPTGRDYFRTFFGVLLAGAAPVPLYPPTRMSQIEEHVRRHAGILKNADTTLLVTTAEMRSVAAVLRAHASSLRRIVSSRELCASEAAPIEVALNPGSTALLQYTSGSTGQPKGVVLSHGNVLANLSALGAAVQLRSDDVFVSWLPLYHDMGLIGAWLGTLYFGLPLVIMSPLSFLTRPVRWLEAIHRYRGTLSAAPNFAYELCLKRVTDEELIGVDLSSWRIAMNGAEPVMPDTLLRFRDRFAKYGFRSSALTPVYGLAECSVGLTVPPMQREPLIDSIERERFMQDGVAASAGPQAVNPLRFASCGFPIAGHHVRIVDDSGRELGERREGRLEFRGPSTTRGYFNNAEATRKLFRDGWLDSGDRAYIAHGELYPTGRIKDIIIRAGRHIYPEELEASIGAIDGIRRGCVAVFGSLDAASGTERVIVLAETRAAEAAQRDVLRQAVVDSVVKLIGEPPDEVVLAPPHTVLKTSSGKIRRAASRAVYESGRSLSTHQPSTAAQVLHLTFCAAGASLQRCARRLTELMYGTYLWALFAILVGLAFLLLLPPLGQAAAWSICHHAARLFVRLAGVSFRVEGLEHVRPTIARLLVANHASYLDGVVLLAALRDPCRFVAKRELKRIPVVGLLLRRLNSVFVERFDARVSAQDAQHLAEIAQAGASCILFPEGTFTRAPGLMPFHLGAFAAAVHAGLTLAPIAIRGTRALLQDEQRLPRRAPIVVEIGPTLVAAADVDAFSAAVKLRDEARRWILARCGEPDLLGGVHA
ncbi:MAG TPA: AMP-binding protein [Steroidobacter sp.]|nr:AMP-binding protein [Steroidobacter sp.]